ncbi:hypothetical protein [Candidatus Palauibacter sp.]|uniref:hypothetical protein n=1 Tax=Candidatus Palauibacter sp. TaxID=3101350 RepID=UPI003AF1E322
METVLCLEVAQRLIVGGGGLLLAIRVHFAGVHQLAVRESGEARDAFIPGPVVLEVLAQQVLAGFPTETELRVEDLRIGL